MKKTITEDAGTSTTSTGSVALVSVPLLQPQTVIRRVPESSQKTKYSNSPKTEFYHGRGTSGVK
jgi:hypothetical protein